MVPVRDRRTHYPFPGIEIGDCGEKIGLNEMDNGWMKFINYWVSKDALLDWLGQVADDGTYSSTIANEGKWFAITVSCLSGGRCVISTVTPQNALQGLSIAIRFACIRRQFGQKK